METTYAQDPRELARQPLGWLVRVHHDLALREALGGRRLAHLPELAELAAPDYLMLLAVGETIARLAVADRGRIIHHARLSGVPWPDVARAVGSDDVDAVRIGYLSWIDRQDGWDRRQKEAAYDLGEADAPLADRRVPVAPDLDLLSDEPGIAAAAAQALVDRCETPPSAEGIMHLVRQAHEHQDAVMAAHRAGAPHEAHDQCPGLTLDEWSPDVDVESTQVIECCGGRGYVRLPGEPEAYRDCEIHPPLPTRQPLATLGLRAVEPEGELSPRLHWFQGPTPA